MSRLCIVIVKKWIEIVRSIYLDIRGYFQAHPLKGDRIGGLFISGLFG